MSRGSAGLIVLAVLGLAIGSASAMTMSSGDTNIVELLTQSNDIVVGRVESVTDGLDERGVPYTEVTLAISESIRGGLSGDYKFRQFGLLAPRLTADGRRKMMPAPAGFPTYKQGEDICLFLRPHAAWTGFRMPAGVTNGKFTIDAGRAENGAGNAGLFRDVRLDPAVVTESDKRLLATASGPLNPDAFLSFVRRAVQEHWVESDRMIRTDRHDRPKMPPPPEPVDANGQTPTQPPSVPATPAVLRDPNASSALPGSDQ
jgi:hypothetical protein